MAKNKILVVDDDEATRVSLENALLSEGFAVVTANDGREGLAGALNEQPQLILTDVEMPGMDGMEMLKELRNSSEWGKKVPVIILTNFDANEKIMRGVIENDPSFYLLKGKVNPEAIVEKVKEKLQVHPS